MQYTPRKAEFLALGANASRAAPRVKMPMMMRRRRPCSGIEEMPMHR